MNKKLMNFMRKEIDFYLAVLGSEHIYNLNNEEITIGELDRLLREEENK